MYSMDLQGHDSVAMANAALLENGRWEPAQVVHTEFILSPEDYEAAYTIVLASKRSEM